MSNEIVLTSKYWDCECAENYIHPRSVSSCAICKSRRSEQPQSRVNEVVAHGLPLMPARRPTPLALDGGDSAASEQLSTPEVLSTLQGESTPAHRK